MGVFRGKGIEDQAAVEVAGEPEVPGQRAVTEIVTSGSFATAWQIGAGEAADAPVAAEPEAEPDPEPEVARHARPDDELSVSLNGWLRQRTEAPAGPESDESMGDAESD